MAAQEAIAELERRLKQYLVDRYPVQRATALFHLGTLCTGEVPERALSLLTECAELFARAGMALEAAKATNAKGVALRELGRPEEAAASFRAAEEAFAAVGAQAERGAALHNLGLAERALGEEAAAATFERAAALLPPGPARAAAVRERAATLLERGQPEQATDLLEGDAPDDDSASMIVLGLALLALGRSGAAVEQFRRAAASDPRALRPREHALAIANLALAYEDAGRPAQARLAARQALAVGEADDVVRAQAQDVLARLGDPAGDLRLALEDEPRERWPPLVREELARWYSDEAAGEREAAAWAAAPDDALDETLLGVLLELPPETFERLLGSLLAGGGEQARTRLERAALLFHAPQQLRVRETTARLWTI